jgi:hypothetical protein
MTQALAGIRIIDMIEPFELPKTLRAGRPLPTRKAAV